jgi:PAS domain-containing protein
MAGRSEAIERLKALDERLSTELESTPPDLVLEHIFDSIPAIVVLLNRNGEVVRANQEAREFVRCQSKSDHKVGKLCETPCSECKLRILAHSVEDAQVMLGQKLHGIVRRFPEHGDVWMRMDKIPYSNPDGEVQGLLVFGIDVTDMMAARGGP